DAECQKSHFTLIGDDMNLRLVGKFGEFIHPLPGEVPQVQPDRADVGKLHHGVSAVTDLDVAAEIIAHLNQIDIVELFAGKSLQLFLRGLGIDDLACSPKSRVGEGAALVGSELFGVKIDLAVLGYDALGETLDLGIVAARECELIQLNLQGHIFADGVGDVLFRKRHVVLRRHGAVRGHIGTHAGFVQLVTLGLAGSSALRLSENSGGGKQQTRCKKCRIRNFEKTLLHFKSSTYEVVKLVLQSCVRNRRKV